MGFDAEAARAFLVAENGNVEAAVRRLCDGETPPPLPSPAAVAPALSGSGGGGSVGGGARSSSQPEATSLEPLAPPPPSRQLNMVVIGHVDAGKSTLIGQLLLLAGQVDARTMHKYERDSAAAGKGSFRFAWVMDQSEEERSRGVTVDVGVAHFATARREVNVLDAPGHRDFVPNMITGAAQADLALLVVNASAGEFESGLSGQTKEHITLARSLGVSRLLVGINQMDSTGWSQARYDEVVAGLAPLLKGLGYRQPPPAFVPLSALTGENLAPGSLPPAGSEWYKGKSLLDEIDEVEPARRASTVGTRLAVVDSYRTGSTVRMSGTLQAGTIQIGQKLLLLPARESVLVKSLASRGVALDAAASATAGDHVEVGVAIDDTVPVTAGMVLCDPARPVPRARRIEIQLRVISPRVMMRGMPLEAYVHSASSAAMLRRFVAPVSKAGEVLTDKKPPRVLRQHEAAIVELDLEREIVLEREADCRHLGRVVLRSEGQTVAAGLVRAILK